MAIFKNPMNGYQEESSSPLSWLWCFLFGFLYFAVRGNWRHFFIYLILAFCLGGISVGVGAGIVWIAYPFFVYGINETHYERQGWVRVSGGNAIQQASEKATDAPMKATQRPDSDYADYEPDGEGLPFLLWLLIIGCAVTMIYFFFAGASASAGSHLHLEKGYQTFWCDRHAGLSEVVLPDRTRCDCITKTHAIEFDFGSKWAESIGQALYYSMQTGKRAGVVLILENKGDYKYWIRLNSVVQRYDLSVDTWIVRPEEVE